MKLGTWEVETQLVLKLPVDHIEYVLYTMLSRAAVFERHGT